MPSLPSSLAAASASRRSLRTGSNARERSHGPQLARDHAVPVAHDLAVDALGDAVRAALGARVEHRDPAHVLARVHVVEAADELPALGRARTRTRQRRRGTWAPSSAAAQNEAPRRRPLAPAAAAPRTARPAPAASPTAAARCCRSRRTPPRPPWPPGRWTGSAPGTTARSAGTAPTRHSRGR